MYFDSHSHYDDEAYDDDRYELIERMHQNGVKNIINIGTNRQTSLFSIRLAEKYDFIYASVGVHPEFAGDEADEVMALAKENKVVAIGEIGLDYHYRQDNKKEQAECFKKQLSAALERDLPVVIHSRDAASDTFNIIKESNVRKGVIHAYSGSAETAELYVDMGYYIGIGGVITFKNARKLVETAKRIPLERILLETDCPYLTPVPFRGKRNDSSMLRYVSQKLAEIKETTVEEICSKTSQNAERLFNIRR